MLNLATVMGAFYGAEKDDISRDDAEGWVRVHKLLGAPTITEHELAFALNYHSDDARIDDSDWKIARRYFEVIERNRDTHPSLATPPERAETPQASPEPTDWLIDLQCACHKNEGEDGDEALRRVRDLVTHRIGSQAKGAAQPDPSVHSAERDGEAVQRPSGKD